MTLSLSEYLEIFSSIQGHLLSFNRKELRLEDSEGSLVAYLAGDMPESIRKDLENHIRAALSLEPGSESLVNMDSQTAGLDGVGPTFPAYHFAYYARGGSKVSFRLSREGPLSTS